MLLLSHKPSQNKNITYSAVHIISAGGIIVNNRSSDKRLPSEDGLCFTGYIQLLTLRCLLRILLILQNR